MNEPLYKIYREVYDEIMRTKEEILRAFVAKYQCEPEEVEIVEQHVDDKIIWRVRVNNKYQPHEVCNGCRKTRNENGRDDWYCQDCVDRIRKGKKNE